MSCSTVKREPIYYYGGNIVIRRIIQLSLSVFDAFT